MTEKEAKSLKVGDTVQVTCSGRNKGKKGTVVRFLVRKRGVNYVTVRPLESFDWDTRTRKMLGDKLPYWNTRFLKKL